MPCLKNIKHGAQSALFLFIVFDIDTGRLILYISPEVKEL